MNALRGALLLAMVSFLLVSWRSDLSAANITTSWERSVVFKIVDEDSGVALHSRLSLLSKQNLLRAASNRFTFTTLSQEVLPAWPSIRWR